MNTNKVLPLTRLCVRQFTQTAVRRADVEVPSAQFKKLKEKQARFQVKDGKPVYLKGGIVDKVLFQTTALLTLLGVGLSAQVFFQLANK